MKKQRPSPGGRPVPRRRGTRGSTFLLYWAEFGVSMFKNRTHLSRPLFLQSLYFLVHHDKSTLLPINRASGGSGRKRQGITIQFGEAHLMRARPRLVPRNIHVIEYRFAAYGIRSSVGDHAILEFQFLFVRRLGVPWFRPIFRNDDRIHTAIRRVTEVPVRMVAKRA